MLSQAGQLLQSAIGITLTTPTPNARYEKTKDANSSDRPLLNSLILKPAGCVLRLRFEGDLLQRKRTYGRRARLGGHFPTSHISLRCRTAIPPLNGHPRPSD